MIKTPLQKRLMARVHSRDPFSAHRVQEGKAQDVDVDQGNLPGIPTGKGKAKPGGKGHDNVDLTSEDEEDFWHQADGK